MEWPGEGSQPAGQPDSEARITVYLCSKLMAMKIILPRHKSTLVFRLMHPECELFISSPNDLTCARSPWPETELQLHYLEIYLR